LKSRKKRSYFFYHEYITATTAEQCHHQHFPITNTNPKPQTTSESHLVNNNNNNNTKILLAMAVGLELGDGEVYREVVFAKLMIV